jgi:type I restriction enzyme R subunit
MIGNNHFFHRLLTEGIDVSYMSDGRQKHDKAWLLDLDNPEANDWLVVNQFIVVEDRRSRRADMVVFVNGLPLAVFELKNPTDETATLQNAYHQFRTYKKDVPSLFTFNELLVVSDGLQALVGTLTSGWDRFMPWRTVEGTEIAPKDSVELEILINGIFDKQRFLDLILNFIVFDDNGGEILKKAAAYHQFHAVNKAMVCTFSACGYFYDPQVLIGRYPAFQEEEKPRRRKKVKAPDVPYGEGTKHFGGRRIGVVWHTQGSGKSLTMAFFAGKLIRHPGMKNPTIVVITDRNDLDEQLFGTFSGGKDLLRQVPKQAKDRSDLRNLLYTGSGGVIFTTIQKFFPETKGDTYPRLSERENIVVIADEAHRSQYDFIDGFARHMRDAFPNASFIGFTGTPIETNDRSTPAVFGDYIDSYDILRAVEDGATVPIYYEGRLAKIHLEENEKPGIDPEFEDITEGEEESEKQKIRSKWARLEAMVGAEKRVNLVIEDLLAHYDRRLEAMAGKVLIVCMSRRICVEVYKAIVKQRPHWHHVDDLKGARRSFYEMDTALRQLVSRAVAPDRVIDIFETVGLDKPDISILSDDFLEEVRRLPYRNLAVELLRKLLTDEIKIRFQRNIVQARSFAEMLEEAILKYVNRTIEAAQVIEELIRLAREMREAHQRGEKIGLNEDKILKTIARELVTAVRRSVTIDWTVRESVRAKIRVMVKHILRKYGYPPDKQEKATETVLKQAEVLCQDWIT